MKKNRNAAPKHFDLISKKLEKLSIISRTMIVILISLSPVLLPAQKTTEIRIIDKRYVAPDKTPKIPEEFKENDARFVVRAGDVIRICNSDNYVAKPFSYSKENRFEGISGNQGLRPGNCITLTAKNPTDNPVIWKLFDEIHSYSKLFLVVLPANWPDEGEESTPSNENGTISVPDVIKECEGGFCGTWTIEGNKFNAVWNNGAKATLTIAQFDNNKVIINRIDLAQSISQNFYAEYTGKLSGNQILEGKVTYKQNGRTWNGTWTANW